MSMGAGGKKLVLAAMIFAVAMTFIDQTIVALAIPELQKDLGLSATGTQWIVNAYLLSLSALFAFGGRLADIAGQKRMVVVGVILFAGASTACGLTPTTDIGEAWMIVFRVIQGAGAAIMFPAALAIVVATYPVNERGKALAAFFGITGGLTAIGPLAGGYLTEWTWRAIFWVNIPVAIIALILMARANLPNERRNVPLDWPGTVLIAGGMGLSVLGLQQSSAWGWDNPATWACIVLGLLLLVGFVRWELKASNPLMRVRIFQNKAFAVDNLILFLLMICFIPLFFFASIYAQIALGEDASGAGLFLLVFFGGFAAGSQIGGRILDERGARPAVVPGCIIAAVGFFLWARKLTDFDLGDQWLQILIAGAGVGLVLSPASTDALNRVPRTMYGEATGITQTVRNFGASLGLAVLGTILILQNKANIESSLGQFGVSKERADGIAQALSQSGGSGADGGIPAAAGRQAKEIFAAVRMDFAQSTQVIFYCMAGVMAVAFVVALIAMPRDRVEDVLEDPLEAEPVAT